MAALPVSEDNTQNMEFNHPAIEVVKFTTQSTDGDYFDSNKPFGQIEATFAAQQTADGNEVRTSFATQTNGTQRVTIIPETAATTGWLVVIGRK